MSFSDFLENELLDHVFAPAAYTAPTNIYVKLHTGDPGEDGTGNAATHTTRVEATFGTASAGTISNDGAVSFTSLAGTETISYFSLWDASTAGNCLGSGALSASKAVTAGDTLTFAIGDIDVSLG